MATFRKREGRWQAQVRKRGAVPQSKTFDTKAAAQRWARGLEHAIDDGRSRGDRVVTGSVADLITRYEREVDPIRRFGRTKSSSLGLLKNSRLGAARARDLDAGAIIAFARQRKADGAGPVTIAMDLSYLGTVLRTARALWRLSVNDQPVREAREACAMIGLVGKSKSRDRRPTQDELDALAACWRANERQIIPMADIVEFAVAAAMRAGEICRIMRPDLNEAMRTVVVRDRKDPRAKEGNDQEIPLLDVTGYDALAIVLRQPASKDGRIFPYKSTSVSTAFDRACTALAIKDLHFHDLRHEGVSRLFEAGLQIHEVSMISGHRDWKTLRRYTQLRPHDITTAFPARSQRATRGPPVAGTRSLGPSSQNEDPDVPPASS